MFDIFWKGTENKKRGIISLLFKTFICQNLESCVTFYVSCVTLHPATQGCNKVRKGTEEGT